MGRNQGKVVRLVSSKKALEMMGYKSQTTLDQFHADEGFTRYDIHGTSGGNGITFAWCKKEINKWFPSHDRVIKVLLLNMSIRIVQHFIHLF